ncbi:MAG: hypothetical protein WBN30_09205, partial [Polyangiales bacterium]
RRQSAIEFVLKSKRERPPFHDPIVALAQVMSIYDFDIILPGDAVEPRKGVKAYIIRVYALYHDLLLPS